MSVTLFPLRDRVFSEVRLASGLMSVIKLLSNDKCLRLVAYSRPVKSVMFKPFKLRL